MAAVQVAAPPADASTGEHQLFRLRTRIHLDDGNLTTRAFPRSTQAEPCDIAPIHKCTRHGQGTRSDSDSHKTASDLVFSRADDGNRTRVFSLGSASRLNASCLRVGCFAWSGPGSRSPGVVRCCAVLHRVVRSSRHGLGTLTVCSVCGQRGDEVVRPRDSVIDVREYVEAVGCFGVDRRPARM
jgi:hypothetical protein